MDILIPSGTATWDFADFAFPFEQTDHRSGQCSILSGLLQPPLLNSQAKQVAANPRPLFFAQIPKGPELQNFKHENQ